MNFKKINSPKIAAVVILIITITTWYTSNRSIDLFNKTRFENLVNDVESDIKFRIQTYLNALTQAQSMFQIKKDIDRNVFRSYVKSLHFTEQYPGILGIGFSLKLSPEELSQHIQEMRKSGFPNYKVWPESKREIYTSIIALEPFHQINQRALGYDMFSEPIRREAMIRTRNEGKPAATDKVLLVQSSDKPQPGFLIYAAVYKYGATLNSVEDRIKNHLGYVYIPCEIGELFRALFPVHGEKFPIDFEVYFGEDGDINNLVYDHDGIPHHEDDSFKNSYRNSFKINVAGQIWTIKTYSLPEFNIESYKWIPLFVLFTGIFLSILVYLIMHNNQIYTEQEKKRSSELQYLNDVEKQRSFQLATINQMGKRLVAELDFSKLVQDITDAGRNITKAQMGAFFFKDLIQKDFPFQLYAISGASIEDFKRFPMPRATEIFKPTLVDKKIVRSADITQDPRYGKNTPHFGIPIDHLKVKSYLAVPIVSRNGEVLGALFYGHEKENIFGNNEESMIEALASQAAIAMDNALLFKKATEAIRFRDEFLSIASHELKTPLTALKLQIQMMLRQIEKGIKTESSDIFLKTAKLSNQQIIRLTSLVDELLDVTRIRAGKLNLHKENINILNLLDEILERMKPQMEAAKTHIIYERPEHELMAEIDALRFEQVMTNLLSNAAKYGDCKPVKMTVEVSHDLLKVAISDEGKGISPEDQQRIFERFERVESSVKGITGLGLGLYITKQIVDAHGGRIHVKSQLGIGTTFIVELPLFS
jgi:signal transduction histidine kinase/CHASE1-domain containing sensor protein